MIRFFLATFLVTSLSSVVAQQLVSASFSSTTPASQLSLFSNAAIYDVDLYKITYYTTDLDGSQTIASGAVVVPHQASCDSFPMAVYEHGTVLLDNQVPSRDNNEALVPKVVASTGAVAVAPDYLGLGDNAGLHPYLHGKTEATATLDLIRAVREFLQDSLMLSLNSEIFITGYSQGGHAAMATAKYVEQENLLGEFNVIAAAPASGPYNLSGSQKDVLISNDPYSSPGYIAYLLLAMERAYGDIFQQYEEIFKAPYDSLIPYYFDGTYDMSFVNSILPDSISGFVQDSVITNFANDSVAQQHPIWRALLANNNYDWSPSFPMKLYYCSADELVPAQNALDAEAAMQANGANVTAVFRGNLSHTGCFLPSMQAALSYFVSMRTECNQIGLEAFEHNNGPQLFPNPARKCFVINGLEGEASIRIYDITGRELLRQSVKTQSPVEVKNWKPGNYFVKLQTEAGIKSFKLLIQN